MNARPVGYDPTSAYAGIINISFDPTQEERHGVNFTTDRLEFVPVQNDAQTVEFYHKQLLGNATVMGNFSSGFVHDYESVSKKVHELAKPWSKGNFGLAFTVRDKETKELIGSAFFDKVRGKEYEFQVLVKETLEDGRSAWNRGIGTEITYAMFQGWAVFLTGKPQGSEGSSFECFNDWEAWDAPADPQMSLLTVTVEQKNYAHRIISRMLESSKVNKDHTKETNRHNVTKTVFYTTPDEMRSARLAIQIGEEMVCSRVAPQTPEYSFNMSLLLDSLHAKPAQVVTPWTFDDGVSDGSPELKELRKGHSSLFGTPEFEFESPVREREETPNMDHLLELSQTDELDLSLPIMSPFSETQTTASPLAVISEEVAESS